MKILAAVLLTACATTAPPSPRGGPRGLRASDHLAAADQHEEDARGARVVPESPITDPERPNPIWKRTWDPGPEQARRAKVHRSKAAALHAAYEEACGERPLSEVSVSPLKRYASGGSNTETGVMLVLAPAAGPADRLLADLRCHRAWMMLAPADMDDCPLDLPGLVVDARGDADGITVTLGVRDRRLVGELQRRAAHEIETSGHLDAR